jgi:hypothetical protein
MSCKLPFIAQADLRVAPWIDPTIAGHIILTRNPQQEEKNRALVRPVLAQSWSGGTQQLYGFPGSGRFFVSRSHLYTPADQETYYYRTD